MERKRTVVVKRSKWFRSPENCGADYIESMWQKVPGLSIVDIVQEQLSASAGERLVDAPTQPQAEHPEHCTDLPEGLVRAALSINDRQSAPYTFDHLSMTDAEQEERLARLFAVVGIELTFIP